MFYRLRIDDDSSRDGRRRRISAKNEVVAVKCDHRRFQSQLCQSAFARQDLSRVIENAYSAQHLGCANVSTDSCPGTQSARSSWQYLNIDIDDLSGAQEIERSEHHTSFERGNVNSGEIDRGSLPRQCPCDLLAVNLNAANANPESLWKHFKFIALVDLARDERSSNDRTKAFHGECAIAWEPRDEVD
jgi:hypothetical protein